MRCSGANVFLTPSHVKESFTAAIVVRSLLAALGEVWVVGMLVGWVVLRLAVCWPVSWDVVVAVVMKWFLLGFGVVWERAWMTRTRCRCVPDGTDSSLDSPDSSRISPELPLPMPDSLLGGFVAFRHRHGCRMIRSRPIA